MTELTRSALLVAVLWLAGSALVVWMWSLPVVCAIDGTVPGAELPGADVPGADLPGVNLPGTELPATATLPPGTLPPDTAPPTSPDPLPAAGPACSSAARALPASLSLGLLFLIAATGLVTTAIRTRIHGRPGSTADATALLLLLVAICGAGATLVSGGFGFGPIPG